MVIIVIWDGLHFEVDAAAAAVLRKFGLDKEIIEIYEFHEVIDDARGEDLTLLSSYGEQLAKLIEGNKNNVFRSSNKISKTDKNQKREDSEHYSGSNNNKKFVFINDTGREVCIHPETIISIYNVDKSPIKPLEKRIFILPEGTYPWVKMLDYGKEIGLSILVHAME